MQWLFGVATMTIAAVLTMYGTGLLYFAATGVYFFTDAYIPIAVFLGMHLLFTDPSTAPRTELGRIAFGMAYALGVMAAYTLLGTLGAPRFYDKLLVVPLLNLCVGVFDRRARAAARLDPARFASGLTGRRRHLGYAGLWVLIFLGLTAARGVGDSHRGRWVPFWQQACAEDRVNGCRQLGVMVSTLCAQGSGWGCNEYGVLLQPERRPILAAGAFARACALGFPAGCVNGDGRITDLLRPPPTLTDYRLLLREGKAQPLPLDPVQLYKRACTQGFTDGCRQVPLVQARTAG